MVTIPHRSHLPPPPQINLNSLIIFKPEDIVISRHEALNILAYFFFHPGVLPADLTENDLSFAQALVIEAIEQSYGYGFLVPNRPIYMSAAITKIAIDVTDRTNGQWNWTAAKEAIIKGLTKHGGIHDEVRNKLSNRYFINWMARVRAKVPAYG